VGAEVLLDREELGRAKALARQDQRLDDARQPAVAVAKRMNRRHVEMRHRRADEDIDD
jgi:hypothetical protein